MIAYRQSAPQPTLGPEPRWVKCDCCGGDTPEHEMTCDYPVVIDGKQSTADICEGCQYLLDNLIFDMAELKRTLRKEA